MKCVLADEGLGADTCAECGGVLELGEVVVVVDRGQGVYVSRLLAFHRRHFDEVLATAPGAAPMPAEAADEPLGDPLERLGWWVREMGRHVATARAEGIADHHVDSLWHAHERAREWLVQVTLHKAEAHTLSKWG